MNRTTINISLIGSFFIIFFFGMSNLLYAQNQKINWVSWDQAQQLMKKQKRKVLVDVYTDWCGWCKKMDASTFQDPRVVKYINNNFYAIKFNAETKEDINFKSKVFKFVPQGNRGYHELAAEITQGRLSYPTFVFMDENLITIQPIPGYHDAPAFEMISNYYGGNHHKNTPWKSYQENFKPENIKY
ncbi:MAG: DUF255 domain-containing protein [Bacteroidota bacterium]|nr:DUF255 domain-containing protein [Bacteroidota bacterium]